MMKQKLQQSEPILKKASLRDNFVNVKGFTLRKAPLRENFVNAKGFTLIEVLVVGALTIGLGFGIIGLFVILNRGQDLVFNDYLSVDRTNTTLSRIIREIRTARNGENGSYVIEDADSQSLTFYSDIDFDDRVEKVRYYLQGTTLYRGYIEPVGNPVTYPQANEITQELTENVQNDTTPLFYYYNGDWPEDTTNNPLQTPFTLSDIKLIRIYIRLNPLPNDPQGDYILDSSATIRIIKDNL